MEYQDSIHPDSTLRLKNAIKTIYSNQPIKVWCAISGKNNTRNFEKMNVASRSSSLGLTIRLASMGMVPPHIRAWKLLSARRQKSQDVLFGEDTGIGIPEEKMSLLFQPFTLGLIDYT